jgi:hypothetical protein
MSRNATPTSSSSPRLRAGSASWSGGDWPGSSAGPQRRTTWHGCRTGPRAGITTDKGTPHRRTTVKRPTMGTAVWRPPGPTTGGPKRILSPGAWDAYLFPEIPKSALVYPDDERREIQMTASGENLDVHEFGSECSEASALAELSDVEIVITGFEELTALSDAELSALVQGKEAGAFSIASFLAPGGGWGGSEVPARRAIPIAARNGLTVTSLKRSSGSPGSDHHVSQRSAFAVDISNGTSPTSGMLRTARQIAAAMGYSWPSNGYLQTPRTHLGHRAQLIYNSSVVPNHHNHVHFGVKKY